LSKISIRQRIDDRSTSFSPVDDRHTDDEDRPAVSLSDCEAEWMERTRVLTFEDALAQLHTDHVPMSVTILQFRRRKGSTPPRLAPRRAPDPNIGVGD
jgi:hypothetical protein